MGGTAAYNPLIHWLRPTLLLVLKRDESRDKERDGTNGSAQMPAGTRRTFTASFLFQLLVMGNSGRFDSRPDTPTLISNLSNDDGSSVLMENKFDEWT